MFKRIDHTELIPSDFERTLSFYCDILGFTIDQRESVDYPPVKGCAFLKLGDTVLELLSVTAPHPMSQEKYVVGCNAFALEVDDMASTVNYLKSKGIEVTGQQEKSGLAIRAKIEDPDGVTIELRQFLKVDAIDRTGG